MLMLLTRTGSDRRLEMPPVSTRRPPRVSMCGALKPGGEPTFRSLRSTVPLKSPRLTPSSVVGTFSCSLPCVSFVRCNFIACTLVLRETVYHLEGCTFERCNWHVDWVLMWGSPESIREIKALVGLIEQAQQQQLPPDQLAQGAAQAPASGQTGR